MIDQANRLWHELPELPERNPSEVTTRLDEVDPLAIYAVNLANDRSDVEEVITKYATRWRLIEPSISGHDLRAMSVTPGPVYKEILKALRDAWLDGKITSRDEEAQLLETLLAGEKIQQKNANVKSQAR
jgi:tRNA nucleotidyltransferase (CCA-adding enzyme)